MKALCITKRFASRVGDPLGAMMSQGPKGAFAKFLSGETGFGVPRYWLVT